jgi:hypothetical protein
VRSIRDSDPQPGVRQHNPPDFSTLVFQHTGGRENDFAIGITFGERQMMAQLIARQLLGSSLINKDF